MDTGSRPRRFGKTLFLDTLRAAFSGEKELFKGLYLENNWNWSEKHPVISISFGVGTVSSKSELALRLKEILNENEKNISCFECVLYPKTNVGGTKIKKNY